ncbi:GAF domain-containing SpoIIE family protein phosphatase [Fibrobacterota bacterium]
MYRAESANTGKNDQLTRELMSNTLVNEVTRVMLSAPTLKESINSYFLGITEITHISRIALFVVDPGEFRLSLDQCSGMNPDQLKNLDLPLSFLSGEYPDAIFLNKHIIVDPVDGSDPFSAIGCRSYVIMPIVSRITTKCWEVKKCGREECVCYEGHNPFCWSVAGAALHTETETEDDKRKACVGCPQFKCHTVVWLDTSERPSMISADAIGHLTGLNRHIGMVIETFEMYDKLKNANDRLEENNEALTTLNEELNLAQEKINRELDRARSIQKGLLPEKFPEKLFEDIASKYIPAGKVGGDYFDCFKIKEDLLGIVIADVSGHGIAAALIMSMFKVLLKTYSPTLEQPEQILLEINETFLHEIKSTNYVTVFYGTFNKKTRELSYCNAGHPPQMLIDRKGDCRELNSNGLFVGILDDIMLQQESVNLNDRSRLVLFTDGITEAKNDQREMYGYEKFSKIIMESKDKTCQESLNMLMDDFSQFRNSQEILDDITLLFLDL